MEQSQLVELIKTLKPKEKEQILQFASLFFFSRSKMRFHIGPLLDCCFNHNWEDSQQKMTKDEVYSRTFPGLAFVEGKLEKAMVEAQKLIRDFLLTQHYFREENEFNQVFDFAGIVRQRGLEARYKNLLIRLHKIQDNANCKDALYFHHQFELELAIHDEASIHNLLKGDLNIPPTIDALEMYSQLHRLALHFLNCIKIILNADIYTMKASCTPADS